MISFVENPWIDGFIVAAITILFLGFVLGRPADAELLMDFVGLWTVVTTFRILDADDVDERR